MTATIDIPGNVSGRWQIDPVHSEVSFTVRHLMVSKVRGRFGSFSGEIVTAPDPVDSSATASIDLTSIDTNNEQRDNHVRSGDFFSAQEYPTMSYSSTGLRRDGEVLVDRRDFGVNFSAAMEGGGGVVGDKVTLALEIEAVLQQPAPQDRSGQRSVG